MAHEHTANSVTQFQSNFSATNRKDEHLDDISSGLQSARHINDIFSGFLGMLLGTRLMLYLYGIQTTGDFGLAISRLTDFLVNPFNGLLQDSSYGAMNGGKVETATILSMIAVAFLGFAVRQFIDVLDPKPLILEDPEI